VELSEITVRVLVALAAGLAVGIEREARGHEAGVGTHTLVALGAVVFTLAGVIGFSSPDGGGDDPWRIAAQVASGIGFIGAGTIIQSRGSVKGLTTAASAWRRWPPCSYSSCASWFRSPSGTGIAGRRR